LLAFVVMVAFVSMMVILVWTVYEHHHATSPVDDPITAAVIQPSTNHSI
jgi:hypothetical protein